DLGTPTIIPVPLDFYDFVLASDGAGQHLVEMKMIEAGSGRFVTGGAMGSIGEFAISEPTPGDDIDGPEIEMYFADRDWVGAPDDAVKPNAWYDGRVASALVMERGLPLFPEEPRRAA